MKQLVRANCVVCGAQNLTIEVELKGDRTFDDGQCPQCGVICSGFVIYDSQSALRNSCIIESRH